MDKPLPPAVLLEPLRVAHAEAMFATLSDPAMYEFMPGKPPASVEALRERYAKLEKGMSPDGQRWLNWIVRLDSGECAGFVQATIYTKSTGDFGFAFAPRYWGRGIARTACRTAMPLLREVTTARTLFATVDRQNVRSIRLLVQLGFGEIAPKDYPHGRVVPEDRVFRLPLDALE